MAASLKVRVARLLCSPSIGAVARKVLSDRIPSRGLVIETDNPFVRSETVASILWGLYERAEISLVRRCLPLGLDVVDLGASIGVVSSHAASVMKEGSRLVSVEANPGILDLLERNVRRNAPWIRHRVVHAAISYGSNTMVDFAVAGRNIDSGLVTTGGRGVACRVPAATLGQVLREHGLGEYALIADIEGAEAEVLRWDRGALQRCVVAVVELHRTMVDGRSVEVDELRTGFIGAGFELRHMRGPVCVFVRKAQGE